MMMILGPASAAPCLVSHVSCLMPLAVKDGGAKITHNPGVYYPEKRRPASNSSNWD